METIYKLQPNRTVHLQGFSDFGAAAALHSTTETSFAVSGVFRDAADFCVLVLWDRDDFYGHPRFSYLPDPDFSGLVLTFDLHYENLQPIDSPKYATIDWPYLNCLRTDGTLVQIPLFAHASQVGGTYTPASGSFALIDAGMQPYDRVTLWYQNLAFDYIVPGKLETEFPFYAAGAGTVHSITVAGTVYTYTEQPGDGSAPVANALVGVLNGIPDSNVEASIGSQAHIVRLVRKLDTGASFAVSASGSGVETLHHIKDTTICRAIRDQINGTDWNALGVPIPLEASASGNVLTVTAARPGEDGNMIRLYELHKNSNLYFTPEVCALAGGSSDATWRVSVDFSAHGVTSLQKAWMTFAPRLANGAEYAAEEWQATFTNWTVADPVGTRTLKVAGPQSVRIEENDSWVVYDGFWEWSPPQFFSEGRARRAASSVARAIVETHCGTTHDIYLGIRLDFDCGIVEVRLDDGLPVELDCYEEATKARQVGSVLIFV